MFDVGFLVLVEQYAFAVDALGGRTSRNMIMQHEGSNRAAPRSELRRASGDARKFMSLRSEKMASTKTPCCLMSP